MKTKNLAYLLSLALDETQEYCDILSSGDVMFDHTKQEFASNLSSIVALSVELINSPLFKSIPKHA